MIISVAPPSAYYLLLLRCAHCSMVKWLREATIIFANMIMAKSSLSELSEANCSALRYCGLWTIDCGLKNLWTK